MTFPSRIGRRKSGTSWTPWAHKTLAVFMAGWRRDRSMPMLLPVLLASALGWSDAIDDIKPGEWYQVPNSALNSVRPKPLPAGSTGVGAVMSAWSGGSFDSKRDRLIIWGGGHSDYAGNEIYVFDVKTLKWSRLTDPSKDVAGNESSGIYPDGTPRARHTYDYVQYVPAIDAFCTFGGAGLYPSGQTGTNKTHCFDFASNTWVFKGDAPTAGTGSVSAVDPETGMAWIQGGGSHESFAQWDPLKNSWSKLSEYSKGWFDYYSTGAAGRDHFLALGEGKLISWDLRTPKQDAIELSTNGDKQIQAANNPGFVFDTKRGVFVAWNGGADVYAFEISTRTWKRVPLSAGNKTVPSAAQSTGTYGRFQYVASRDVYIGVNGTDENVFLFRFPDGFKLPVDPNSIRPGAPRKAAPKLEIRAPGRSGSLERILDLAGAPMPGAALSCRIYSLQRELYRADGLPGPSGTYVLRLDAPAAAALASAGPRFLRIQSGERVLLSGPLGAFP